ncbi:hypothetical protein CAG58_03820 [Vibrio sp. V31_P5A7T61]|uniref:hypothetical protein n=1 Tax=unclassified Vibrio TaxID=2614977 RepID=UPI00137292A2|nr:MULTISPECIES: hypothetical protein [unclassified Vibrio]NAW61091.1 hypothetical protein [Vibrio sp. V31_P5A7T61]NAX02089.1 hypothetical protein [Vibrio sp. V34_P3A8T189]NAX07051.1 hypothetical protein [Vibrio sp. V40_P2S30T141]NAX63832.1 hypothetical protein [Vibrio sp. V32_P6A28T40]
MSFIQSISEPKDMLLKLIREGNRITFEEDPENLTDHFFNFSVTAHSIRDWCIKYQGQQAIKKKLDQQWDKEPFLAIAKDIANSVKHFGIDRYQPQLKESETQTTNIVEFCVGENISEKLQKAVNDKEFRESEGQDKPSYLVRFEDGTEMTLTYYVLKTVTFWVSYFDQNSIPREQSVGYKHLYVNRPFWQQFT